MQHESTCQVPFSYRPVRYPFSPTLPTSAQFHWQVGGISPSHSCCEKVQTSSACTTIASWKLSGFLPCFLCFNPAEATLVAEPRLLGLLLLRTNLTNNPYNLTFNLVISFYNFLDKIYRALHFASPTSLNLSRTSGSGLAVLLFYLDLSSASLLLGPGQCFSSRAM